jgi:MFS family permease
MPIFVSPSFLAVSWLLVVFVIVALWFAAIADIMNRSHEPFFGRTRLIIMAVAVSVAAVLSVGTAGAVLVQAHPGDSLATLDKSLVAAGYATCQDPTSSFVFSFGVERAKYQPSGGAVDRPQPSHPKFVCRV